MVILQKEGTRRFLWIMFLYINVCQCHNWGTLAGAGAGDAATQFIKVPPPLMADTTTGIITQAELSVQT